MTITWSIIVAINSLWFAKRFFGASVDRLGERFADWLFPRDKSITYRLANVVLRVVGRLAPAGTSARGAVEGIEIELAESRAEADPPLQPVAAAVSLAGPAFRARGRTYVRAMSERLVTPIVLAQMAVESRWELAARLFWSLVWLTGFAAVVAADAAIATVVASTAVDAQTLVCLAVLFALLAIEGAVFFWSDAMPEETRARDSRVSGDELQA